MHLVITLRAGAGVRLVCELLRLGGLSGVVGASYGSQQAMNVQVQAGKGVSTLFRVSYSPAPQRSCQAPLTPPAMKAVPVDFHANLRGLTTIERGRVVRIMGEFATADVCMLEAGIAQITG